MAGFPRPRALLGIRSGGRLPSDLARLPIVIDLRAVSLEEGVRAGLSVAVLVGLNEWLHAPLLLEAALAALLTCLCDSGGPIRRRVPYLLSFALIGSLLTAAFGLARPLGYPLIPAACLGIFALALVRIYGQAAQQVGNLLSVVLVLALDRQRATVHDAITVASAFLGGSLWAALLTMGIWRLHPNRPTRQAVARVYLAMAAMCDDLRGLLALRDAAAQHHWEHHARAHRRAVRDLIEQARGVVADRLQAGGTAVRPATQSLLRLESAEQMFGALIALTDLLESAPAADARGAAEPLTARVGALLAAIAPRIVDESSEGLAAIGREIDSVALIAMPHGDLRRIALLLTERLRATITLTGAVAPDPGPAATAPTVRLLQPLRDNLDWNSAALRHAARAALVAAAGLAITFTWPTSYQHWLTITLVLTLQPYYALTLQRALERIGGTVLGGLLAAALTLVCRSPLAIAAAVFPLSMLALSLRAVNFGLYITALTPMIVLLVELGHNTHGFTIAAMRALYTLIGGALAILGCIFLWPSWEPGRLDAELRTALRCHGNYAALELDLLLGHATPQQVDAARQACGMASNNLEASLSRALLEPGSGRKHLESAVVVDACLRRMAGRLSAMLIDPTTQAEPATLRNWRDWITQAIAVLDASPPIALAPPPADIPADTRLAESLALIARQLTLAAGALQRYTERRTE